MKERNWPKIVIWTLVLAVFAAFVGYEGYLFWLRECVDEIPLAEETVACVDFDAVARNVEFFEERGFESDIGQDGYLRLYDWGDPTEITIIMNSEDAAMWSALWSESWKNGTVTRIWYRDDGRFEVKAVFQDENACLIATHHADNPFTGVKEMDAIIQQLFADLAACEAAK